MHLQHQQAVMAYYQRTTRWFLRFGQTRQTGSIHRALRLPNVTVPSPTDTIHALIAHELLALTHGSVAVDLGCGVRSALAYMRQRYPEWGLLWGITLSYVQAQRAHSYGRSVVQGSFHQLPVTANSADAAWAIESLIHSDQPVQFFAEISRYLRIGGILILCDDMSTNESVTAMQRLFQKGWLAPNLVSATVHQRYAQTAGFRLRTTYDLTAGIQLRALPHWLAQLIAWCAPLWQWNTLLCSMVGSMALQQCLADGSIRYMMMVFEKNEQIDFVGGWGHSR